MGEREDFEYMTKNGHQFFDDSDSDSSFDKGSSDFLDFLWGNVHFSGVLVFFLLFRTLPVEFGRHFRRRDPPFPSSDFVRLREPLSVDVVGTGSADVDGTNWSLGYVDVEAAEGSGSSFSTCINFSFVIKKFIFVGNPFSTRALNSALLMMNGGI